MSGASDVALRLLICGGGALAHVFAGVIGALPNSHVTVLSRRPKEWSNVIVVYHANLAVVGCIETTNDPAAAADATAILVAAPAYAHAPIVRRLRPHIRPKSWIGALPAIGGFDLLIRDLLPAHVNVFGSLRAPYNARVQRYGHEVLVTGVIPRLDLVVGPGADRTGAIALVHQAFGLPLRVVAPFLSATLSPAGTIFHAARLFELVTEPVCAHQGFYAGWGAAAGRAYLAMDGELAALRRALSCEAPGLDAASHYGVSDADALAARIRALPGLPEIAVPISNGQLDASHRFVREDITYGLCVVRHLAAETGLPCPVITTVLETLVAAAGPASSSLLALPRYLASIAVGGLMEARD